MNSPISAGSDDFISQCNRPDAVRQQSAQPDRRDCASSTGWDSPAWTFTAQRCGSAAGGASAVNQRPTAQRAESAHGFRLSETGSLRAVTHRLAGGCMSPTRPHKIWRCRQRPKSGMSSPRRRVDGQGAMAGMR
jgi:hypothetical protein